MRKLIVDLLNRLGYTIVKNDTWKNKTRVFGEHELLVSDSIIERFIKPNTMVSEIRLKNIQNLVSYIIKANIPGDFVECGVWKGGACGMMVHALNKLKSNRKIHLYDAFDDIVEPDGTVDGDRAIKDVGGLENAKGRLKPVKGIYDKMGGAGNDKEVFDLISNKIGYPESLINIQKGLFQDTLPLNNIEKISFLRLDGDWYASTKVCLEFLYPKLYTGGVIVIDDYLAYEGCKKAVDEYLQVHKLYPLIESVDSECIYWIKQQ
jgi:O-methyltransferase